MVFVVVYVMCIDQQFVYVLYVWLYCEMLLLLECLICEYGWVGVVVCGVCSEKGWVQCVLLELFQCLVMDLLMCGEFVILCGVELLDVLCCLLGDYGLVGLYVNELVVCLIGWQDLYLDLFDSYVFMLVWLFGMELLVWMLCCFECDFLQVLGYVFVFDYDVVIGVVIDLDMYYCYYVESGLMLCMVGDVGVLCGEVLLVLVYDWLFGLVDLQLLCGMMCEVICFYFGGGELCVWQVLVVVMLWC